MLSKLLRKKNPQELSYYSYGKSEHYDWWGPPLFEFAPENRIIKKTLTGLESILIE
jgi:hypothetical protein